MILLGIDIGGTKTAVCAGTRDGVILASRRMAALPDESFEVYLGRLLPLCRQVLDEAGIQAPDAVGIAAPGPLNRAEGILIAPPNNPGWKNVPLSAALRKVFPVPLFLENDANACALAEYLFGARQGTPNLVYLTASTGMGGGIIIGGRLLRGVTDTGGEVGHQVLDPEGPPCACGQRGCWEVYVGGKALADRVREELAGKGIGTKILDEAGGDPNKIDHRAIAAAARAGDRYALARWEEYTERLAQGIGGLIQLFNPEAVILGTIAVKEGEFLMGPLRDKLNRYAWKWPLLACAVEPSSLGALIGELAGLAAALTGLDEPRQP